MIEYSSFALSWMLCTGMLAVLIYLAALWSIPYLLSDRALSGIRRRAGVNVLIHRPPNTADNCRIPMAVADAIMSICVFDVSRCPVRISAAIPRGLYWSISCYARNTDNFFVMNDTDASDRPGDRVAVVLQKNGGGYRPRDGELVVDAPSNTGIVLIRMVVSDPTDADAIAELARTQRRAYAEEVDDDQEECRESARFRVDVCTPYHEIHVRICDSLKDIEQMISRDYNQSVTIGPSMQGRTIELSGGFRAVFDIFRGADREQGSN